MAWYSRRYPWKVPFRNIHCQTFLIWLDISWFELHWWIRGGRGRE